ncbi:unnamed protein product [Spirodela intermedia]|uniref:Uncharacterized protein n=1 Tax=Spirodela intermedia TaxID=51605 RepID=A0A7I8KEX3_SPIIN|nr:unnamed protein product [Spirodela intermedia]
MAGRLILWLLSLAQPLHLDFFAPPLGGAGGPSTIANSCAITSIYSLGDSIADTGNLLYLAQEGGRSPSTSLPYGETLQKATGRSSDGYLMIDYIAAAFDLPNVPPYMDKSANFDYGVNFAVGGATALNQSFFLKRGISLPVTSYSLELQLQWFNAHINHICLSKEDCSNKFRKALFLVGEIGGNDYSNSFRAGKSMEEVKTYVPQVVGTIIATAKALINVGARRLVVPGNFPIGCMPIYLTLFKGRGLVPDERGCLKSLNSFAEYHNEYLQKAIRDLKKTHPDITISYGDYYNPYLTLIDKAHDYGFEKNSLLKACCGSGGDYNFDLKNKCGNPGVQVCVDPSRFISWDGIHLTQEAYKNMGNMLISEFKKEWKCRKQAEINYARMVRAGIQELR